VTAGTGVSASNPWAVETDGLCKSFGHRPALRNVRLQVPDHDFLTIIGPNGAGKTTLLRLLATLSRPSSGRIRVRGLDARQSLVEVRRHIGFTSHQTLLYGDLTATENLTFYGRMYGLSDLPQRIADLLEKVGLAQRRDDCVRTLSRGMQQRLAIARAILHDPAILFLDEPYAGLDPRAGDALTELLRDLRSEGRTILMTKHDLERGAELSDQILVLLNGRVVHQSSATGLSGRDWREIYRQHTEAQR
jgi:heme exporter protein A